MSNQEYLASLPPEECCDLMHQLWFEYGLKWTDTRQAIIAWLEEEHATVSADDPGPADGAVDRV